MIRGLLQKIRSIEWGHVWIFILVTLILSPNIFLVIKGTDYASGPITKKLSFIVFSALLFLIPTLFINIRTLLFIATLFVFWLPFEFFHIFLYDTASTVGAVGALLDTNMNETREFLLNVFSFMGNSPFLGTLYVLLPFSSVLYLLTVKTKIPKAIRLTSTMKKVHILATLAFLSSFFVHDAFAVGKFPNPTGSTDFVNRLYDTYPYGSFTKLLQACNQDRLKRSRPESINGFTFNAEQKKKLNAKEVYVLIVGESSRYSNWGINGYERKTSPELKRINGLISYSNVAACSSQTRQVIPIMFTRARPDDYNVWYREKTFLAALKECDYKTYWISNQAMNTSAFNPEADEAIYLNPDKHSGPHYDGGMLPILKKILERNEPKVFIVIHTMGSHQNYWSRYPDEFDVFNPSLKQQEKQHGVLLTNIKNRQMIINSYDNSILYTDFFISSVIRMVANTHSLSSVVFMSDHGENLCDDSRQLYYRGRPIPSKYEAKIPMFIWLSNSYKKAYPGKAQNFIAHKDQAISTENIFYSMLDMCNIGYNGEDLTKSIANSTFSEKERKFLTVSYTVIPYKNLF